MIQDKQQNNDAIQERFDIACELVLRAGARALSYYENRAELAIDKKDSDTDVVTMADRNVETLIRGVLEKKFPLDCILGEEGGFTGSSEKTGVWVIDPIDGTWAFVHGIPLWSICIAFINSENDVELGIVYDPIHNELFSARRGHGATLNGTAIQTINSQSLTAGSIGICTYKSYFSDITADFIKRLTHAGGTWSRIGSCALSLAWVSAGRQLGFYQPWANSWDCLAGIHLVKEAGGWTSDFMANNGLIKGNTVLACGKNVHDAFISIAQPEEIKNAALKENFLHENKQ